MSPEVVEGAGADERLEDALVAHAEVDVLAQCIERGDRPFLARGEDRVDGGPPDVADRAESEADLLVADDGELVTGLVDVGGKDLDPELTRLIDILHDAVGVTDAGR